MREMLYPEHVPSEPDPVKRAQVAMARQALPKRFYTDVTTVEGVTGFSIQLDGRVAKTPGRRMLALPNARAAEIVATEWRQQVEVIDPAKMHATRMVNTAIDSFDGRIAEIQADIAGYAASDLVCYRASEPEGLVAAQNIAWTPVLDWAARTLPASFVLAEGIIHRAQGEAALNAVASAVAKHDQPIPLAALHVMTTLAGSCLIALMAADGSLTGPDAWATATVDERWQASLWGSDDEAVARMTRREQEFMAAYGLCRAFA